MRVNLDSLAAVVRPGRKRYGSSAALDSMLSGLPAIAASPAHVPLSRPPGRVELRFGVVSLNPRGFGFIAADDGMSYFLRSTMARYALAGDRVQFIPSASAEDGEREVRVLLSISRPTSRLMCEVHLLANIVHLVPDDPCFIPLKLSDGQCVEGLSTGDVVAVQLPAYDGPPVFRPVSVVVARNLGPRSREGFDIDYARVRYGFDVDFSSPLRELHFSAPTEPTTGPPFVTIDGEFSKDFDDALFARARAEGGWDVSVAIADVSYYVQPGDALDGWAAKRCTSVYLPGQVLPMLPERLSTDTCSLVPGKPRRAVVLGIVLAADGQVVSSSLRREVIQSAARLTYDQVAEFLALGESSVIQGVVAESIQALRDVYRRLSQERQASGLFEFDEPEAVMIPADDGTWSVKWERRTEAHKLVESMMLLANRLAADRLVARYGAGLFRHQPPPDSTAWGELQLWSQARQHELPQEPSLGAMSRLIAAMPEGARQLEAMLRVRSTMRPAKYVLHRGADSAGHFSLNMDWYTHFTSPIRRYADLLVHRLLLADEASAPNWDALASLVGQCSERAQAARMAERLVLDKLKLAGFLAQYTPSDVIQARVVRSAERGLRVVLAGWQCSAWLPGSELRTQGYKWTPMGWALENAEASSDSVVSEGSTLRVRWAQVSRSRPAYPELQVALAVADEATCSPD